MLPLLPSTPPPPQNPASGRMTAIGRPQTRRRLPEVLSLGEVAAVFSHMTGEHALLAKLLDGPGLRISEVLQLRVSTRAAIPFRRRSALRSRPKQCGRTASRRP